jgi:hypothetical protein
MNVSSPALLKGERARRSKDAYIDANSARAGSKLVLNLATLVVDALWSMFVLAAALLLAQVLEGYGTFPRSNSWLSNPTILFGGVAIAAKFS